MVEGSDGSGVCLNHCGMDLDCRPGYHCRHFEEEAATVCWGGCNDATTCPIGYLCAGGYCIDEAIACSADNPYGECPKGKWCKDGACTDELFVCRADEADELEPNDSLQTAVVAPVGDTQGLTICEGDEDCYEITLPAAFVLRVGIQFMHEAGDIDLVIYDELWCSPRAETPAGRRACARGIASRGSASRHHSPGRAPTPPR